MELQSQKTTDIIAAAREVFSEYGFKKVTMDDVALKLGITRTSLYYYYKNKEDLFLAMMDDEFNNYRQNQTKAAEKCSNVSERIHVFAKEQSLLREKFANVYRFTHTDIHEIPRVAVEIRNRLHSIQVEILKGILVSEAIPPKEAERIAAILSNAIRGIGTGPFAPKPSEAMKDVIFLLENFIHGLCASR